MRISDWSSDVCSSDLRDEEFNAWYSGPHLADLRRLPGVVSARRFRIADTQIRDQASPHRYLAIYEIETDDPQSFTRALLARAGTELLATSPALAADEIGRAPV